ncbi:MAG: 23S rRNA pseudouridine(1911/1915/1917) synthase RluD [Methylophilaceae bacterium]|jgi:23S rRNA pseudouridine1911/1915/1917 synthase|nr:23S rRNA pseudouridine(1911/1915/1917) synthase RluD [Methylophilaceae bacterium]
MSNLQPIILIIPQDCGGMRLDQALQKLMPAHSRSRLQAWIKDDFVKLNGAPATAKTKVWQGDQVAVLEQANPQSTAYQAEDIALNIVYEDEAILVINKPAGMVVHPASGNWSGTLLNALLHHVPALADIPRAGIVHRLDKDTSGLLVVAKTLAAQTHLVRQLQARTVKREYRTIVWGQIWRNGSVDQPVGRHPTQRTRMAVNRNGKPAVTRYEVLERFGVHTYLRCMLETGRTHQIRVHMQFLKAPIVGDPVYGYRGIVPVKLMSEELLTAVQQFPRQALHAIKLGLVHPTTGLAMEWQIELADDMKQLLELMRQDLSQPEEVFEFDPDEGDMDFDEDIEEDWLDDDDE